MTVSITRRRVGGADRAAMHACRAAMSIDRTFAPR
jgi:hypothetical protein